MRITIKTKPEKRELIRTGFISKRFGKVEHTTEYQVLCVVKLSQEEKAIVTENELWDTAVYNHSYYVAPDAFRADPEVGAFMRNGEIPVTIEALCREEGQGHYFPTAVDAKRFEQKLRNEYLPKLKRYIQDSHRSSAGGEETFEL